MCEPYILHQKSRQNHIYKPCDKQTYNKSRQGGEARGFDPGTSAPITTSTTNAPPPWDVAGNGAETLKSAPIWGISEGAWPIARAPQKPLFFII
jgi:hypothetical protein